MGSRKKSEPGLIYSCSKICLRDQFRNKRNISDCGKIRGVSLGRGHSVGKIIVRSFDNEKNSDKVRKFKQVGEVSVQTEDMLNPLQNLVSQKTNTQEQKSAKTRNQGTILKIADQNLLYQSNSLNTTIKKNLNNGTVQKDSFMAFIQKQKQGKRQNQKQRQKENERQKEKDKQIQKQMKMNKQKQKLLLRQRELQRQNKRLKQIQRENQILKKDKNQERMKNTIKKRQNTKENQKIIQIKNPNFQQKNFQLKRTLIPTKILQQKTVAKNKNKENMIVRQKLNPQKNNRAEKINKLEELYEKNFAKYQASKGILGNLLQQR